jgi:hypothetical protein
MDILFYFEKKNDAKIKECLAQEPFSRGSYNIKDANLLGSKLPGNYLLFSHDAASIEALKTALKDLVEPVKDPAEIMKKIKQEEDSASAGMGFVFG